MSNLNETVKGLVTKEDFGRLEQRTEKIEQRVDKLEKTTQKISAVVVDHTKKINELVTRKGFSEKIDGIYKGQDKILAMLTHLERERIFAFDRIERLEGEVDKIKKHLTIA